jgi:hypothetical protein
MACARVGSYLVGVGGGNAKSLPEATMTDLRTAVDVHHQAIEDFLAQM